MSQEIPGINKILESVKCGHDEFNFFVKCTRCKKNWPVGINQDYPSSKVKNLIEAAIKAKDMIESEYCSHDGPHASDNPKCYSDFLHKALKEFSE